MIQDSLPQLRLKQMQAVCAFLQLPESGWSKVDENIACSSHTWMHDNWVLQQKPRMRYRRMRSLYQASLRMDGHLKGFRYHGPMVKLCDGQAEAALEQRLNCDTFWIAQPRLQGEVMFNLQDSPDRLLRRLALATPKIAADLDWLSRQQLDMFELYKTPPTNGIVQQNSSFELLMCMVDTDPRIKRISSMLKHGEPTSPRVISHGDPTLKNTIQTQDSVELVDWESVWLLPRHRDFTHQVAFLCKYLPEYYWQQAMDIVWNSAQQYLPGWDARTWQIACVWQLLREVVFFPPHNPTAYHEYLQGLEKTVADLG